MIISSFSKASAFISGTINFLLESILHAEELSMTFVPFSANFGAHSNDVDPPAEKRAIAGFNFIASSMETTG